MTGLTRLVATDCRAREQRCRVLRVYGQENVGARCRVHGAHRGLQRRVSSPPRLKIVRGQRIVNGSHLAHEFLPCPRRQRCSDGKFRLTRTYACRQNLQTRFCLKGSVGLYTIFVLFIGFHRAQHKTVLLVTPLIFVTLSC